jgi:hypothetical protein
MVAATQQKGTTQPIPLARTRQFSGFQKIATMLVAAERSNFKGA